MHVSHLSLAHRPSPTRPCPLLHLDRPVVYCRQHLPDRGDHYVDDAGPIALGESGLKGAGNLTRFVDPDPMAAYGLSDFGVVGSDRSDDNARRRT